MGDGTKGARGEHDLMLIDERVFVHGSEDVASGDVVTDLSQRCKLRDLNIEQHSLRNNAPCSLVG